MAFTGHKEGASTIGTIGAFVVLAAFLNGYYILKRGLYRAKKRFQDGKPVLTKSLLDDDDS